MNYKTKILCPPELQIHHLELKDIIEKYGVISHMTRCSICRKVQIVLSVKDYQLLPYEYKPPCDSCHFFTLPPLRDRINWNTCSDETLLSYAPHCFKQGTYWSKGERGIIRANCLKYLYKKDSSFCIFEMKYRGLLPTLQELHMCCDLEISEGEDPGSYTFFELWEKYIWEIREI